MEIGVYNGDNAVSMVKSALRVCQPGEVLYVGFDFFSQYKREKVAERMEELGCRYRLFQGNTVDTLPSVIDSLPLMGIIFIDGGKSYPVASSDWEWSSRLMHDKTGVFIHNAGFRGVARVVKGISREVYHVDVFDEASEGKVALIKKREKDDYNSTIERIDY